MAERRLSLPNLARNTPSLRDPEPWRSFGRAVWLLQDTAGQVRQPFFVALDRDGRVCWTDECSRALPFAGKNAADRFALDRMTQDVRVVRSPIP